MLRTNFAEDLKVIFQRIPMTVPWGLSNTASYAQV